MSTTTDLDRSLEAVIARAEEAIRRRDFAASRHHYEAALALLGPDRSNVAIHSGLGWALQHLGEPDAALVHYEAAHDAQLEIGSSDAPALDSIRRAIADVLAILGRHDEALGVYQLLLETVSGPNRHPLLQAAADAARAAGLHEEARRHRDEALDMLRQDLPHSRLKLAGTLTLDGLEALRAGRLADAEGVLREAIALQPGLGQATEALIEVLLRQDRMAAAREAARLHCAQKSFWIRRGKPPVRSTLLTLYALSGNIREQHLLARLGFAQVIWQIEFGPDQDDRFPPYDLVFNEIADADTAAAALREAIRFAERCRVPILNHPALIGRTRRDRINDVLGSIDGVFIPRTIRVETADPAAAWAEAQHSAIGAPLIVRAAGRHGGSNVSLANDRGDLERIWAGLGEREATYLTQYADYRSPDGCFRKYRVMFIDRRPYPYHLAISSDWLVHYFSADMAGQASKLEEERHFLADMERALGPVATAALAEIGRRLDLDYAGIDFGLRPDGTLLLFEVNATMVVHPEDEGGPLAHKNEFVGRILQAFDDLVLARAGQAAPGGVTPG